jgi:hypothetical protein
MQQFKRIKLFKLSFKIIFLFSFQTGISQISELKNTIFIESNYQYGYIIPHHDYLAYFVNQPVQGFHINIGTKTTGNKQWQQTFNYPSIGLGYYYGSLGNEKIFGNLHALYLFFDRYYLNLSNRFNVGNRIEFGLGYADRIYDQRNNPYNMALSTHINVYIQFCLEASFYLTPQLQLISGLGGSHTSNGAFKVPNSGLNFITSIISLQYSFAKGIKYKTHPIISIDSSKNEFIVYGSYGLKDISRFDNKLFSVYSINMAYNRKLNSSKYIGFNIYTSFDRSIADELHLIFPYPTVSNADQIRIALNASYEIRMGKLSFVFQPGIYLRNKSYVTKNICNRLGIRYYSDSGLIANLALNAHWLANADVLEWGIGYRFKK